MKRSPLLLLACALACACGPTAQTPSIHNPASEEEINIGYGSVKKKDLTTAVDKIEVNPNVVSSYTTIAEYIRGRVAGVEVNPNGTIRIRGANSINSPTEALIVVDGTICDNINSINPNDVHSVEVLKDGGSAAIYGSRGANGVVLITTKSSYETRLNEQAERKAQIEKEKAERKAAREAAKQQKKQKTQ